MSKCPKWAGILSVLDIFFIYLSKYCASALVYEVHGYEFPDMPQPEKREKAAIVLPEVEELPENNKMTAEGIGTAGTLSQVDESGLVYQDGAYTGTATGFGGPITVSVTIKNGKITGISVISASGETGEYLSSARAVLSRIISGQTTNVDAVSGATYSSNGILNAVRRALNEAVIDETQKQDVQEPVKETEKELTDDPIIITDPGQGFADGVYTGTGEGWGGTTTLQLTILDGQVSAIELDCQGRVWQYRRYCSSCNWYWFQGCPFSGSYILQPAYANPAGR